jgi:hypothetical protein
LAQGYDLTSLLPSDCISSSLTELQKMESWNDLDIHHHLRARLHWRLPRITSIRPLRPQARNANRLPLHARRDHHPDVRIWLRSVHGRALSPRCRHQFQLCRWPVNGSRACPPPSTRNSPWILQHILVCRRHCRCLGILWQWALENQ